MDIFSLLMNAKIVDTDDEEYGDVVEVVFSNGKLTLVIDMESDDEDDEDDPEKEPVPQPNIREKIKVVSGGKKTH